MTQPIPSATPIAEAAESDAAPLAVVEEAAEFGLLALIREELENSDEPAPHVVGKAVFEAIPPAHYGDVLARVIPRLVRDLLRRERRRPQPGEAVNDRWAVVRDGQNAGALQILRWRISLGSEDWKFFEDCARADVEQIVADYTRRAVENADQAQRFKAVLSAMTEAKVERVGDLDLDRLVTIFHA